VSDSKKKCFPLWDGYCMKSKRCVKNCNDPDKGKGFTKGRCKIFTCECCRPDTPDELLRAPTSHHLSELARDQIAVCFGECDRMKQ